MLLVKSIIILAVGIVLCCIVKYFLPTLESFIEKIRYIACFRPSRRLNTDFVTKMTLSNLINFHANYFID